MHFNIDCYCTVETLRILGLQHRIFGSTHEMGGCMVYTGNAYLGQLVPRSLTRTQVNSYPGQLVPKSSRTRAQVYTCILLFKYRQWRCIRTLGGHGDRSRSNLKNRRTLLALLTLFSKPLVNMSSVLLKQWPVNIAQMIFTSHDGLKTKLRNRR